MSYVYVVLNKKNYNTLTRTPQQQQHQLCSFHSFQEKIWIFVHVLSHLLNMTTPLHIENRIFVHCSVSFKLTALTIFFLILFYLRVLLGFWGPTMQKCDFEGLYFPNPFLMWIILFSSKCLFKWCFFHCQR